MSSEVVDYWLVKKIQKIIDPMKTIKWQSNNLAISQSISQSYSLTILQQSR